MVYIYNRYFKTEKIKSSSLFTSMILNVIFTVARNQYSNEKHNNALLQMIELKI